MPGPLHGTLCHACCRAFPNARALAKDGAAKQLVAALSQHEQQPQEVTTALATALKQVGSAEQAVRKAQTLADQLRGSADYPFLCTQSPQLVAATVAYNHCLPVLLCFRRWQPMTRSAKRWLLLVGCSWLCKS